MSTDPIGYDPFSIAQYISQQNPTHNPRIHGAVLQNIDGHAPFVTAGTPSSGLNTSFPILRNVYDVVKLSRLTTAGDPIDTLFNGVGSTICKQRVHHHVLRLRADERHGLQRPDLRPDPDRPRGRAVTS